MAFDQTGQAYPIIPVPVAPALPALCPSPPLIRPIPITTPMWNYPTDIRMSQSPGLTYQTYTGPPMVNSDLTPSASIIVKNSEDEYSREQKNSWEMPEEEHLMMRRNEIISRLQTIDNKGDDCLDDDLER